MLKTPKRRESLEIFAPPPYRGGHDHELPGAHQRKTGAITSRLIKLGFMTEGQALPSNSYAANERTEFAKSG